MTTSIPYLNLIKKIVHYKKVTSTMDVAKELINFNSVSSPKNQESCLNGTLIIADQQTNGRGRFKRQWLSPKGGLYLSLILNPECEIKKIGLLSFVASISVVETLRKLYKINTTTKWPNDVLSDEKKISGILIETVIPPIQSSPLVGADFGEGKKSIFFIIGIGLNVNTTEKSLKNLNATSVQILTGKKVDKEKLVSQLISYLTKWYKKFVNKKYDEIITKWKKCSSTIGKQVEIQMVDRKIVGKAVDISPSGSLIVEHNDKKTEILSGDCVHLRT